MFSLTLRWYVLLNKSRCTWIFLPVFLMSNYYKNNTNIMSVYFSTICHVTSRKLRLPQCIMGDDLHIWSYLVQNERGERNTCSFRSPWVTLPLNLFFPTHFVLFPSALIWAVDARWNCLSCRIRFISSSMWCVCCLRMQIIWRAALSSSHHAMRCCHHSVSIARSRLMAEK